MQSILIKGAINKQAQDELNAMELNELIPHYIQWADKFIRPKPRKLYELNSFDSSKLKPKDKARLQTLMISIEKGDNLSPFLSKKAEDSFGTSKPDAKGIGWSDSGGTYDMFLNAYGVHHLHLIPENENGKRKGNSDALLFVGFFINEAVLLMLGTHKSFHDGSLLTAATEFQGANDFSMKGIVGVDNELSNKDHQRMLRYGTNTTKQTMHGDFVPSMIAMAGNGTMHMMHSSKILRAIRDVDPLLNTQDGRKKFEEKYKFQIPENADLQYTFDHCHFALFDMKTERQIFCIPWQR